MSEVEVRGIRKSYGGPPVLTGVDLHVPARSLTAVLGSSGCGKTTLLRVVAGFEVPDEGSVRIGGRAVVGPEGTLAPERRGVGYLAQEGLLFPHLDVTANVLFGLPRRERRRAGAADDLLETVGLDPALRTRYPHELSGGQQQRVALARALAPQPAVVLLDEPFSSLDAGLRADTRRAVVEALAKAGATGLLVTHDRAEALSVADQVAVMRGGEIVQAGDPVNVYRTPVDPEVAAMVGDAIVVEGEVHGGVVDCPLGRWSAGPDDAAGRVRVLVRPEQLVVDPAGRGARVQERSFRGGDVELRLVLDTGVVVNAAVAPDVDVPAGAEVGTTVRGGAVLYPA